MELNHISLQLMMARKISPFPAERFWSNSVNFSWFLARITLTSRGLLGLATKTCENKKKLNYKKEKHEETRDSMDLDIQLKHTILMTVQLIATKKSIF